MLALLKNRLRLVSSLAVKGVTDAVPVLTGIIARGNENLIAEACWSLGEIGDRRAVSTLIQVLQRNERLFVLKALEALG